MLADLPLRKVWKWRRRHMTSSNNQSNHRHQRRKCNWMTLTRVFYGDHRQHVLNPWQHQNRAQTAYWLHWQQGSSSQISSNEVCLYTLWGESKSADWETRCSPQQDHIPSQGQGIERGRLHSRLYMMMTLRQTEDKIWQVLVLRWNC